MDHTLTYANPSMSVSVKSSCSGSISNKPSDTGTSVQSDSVPHSPQLSSECLDSSALPLEESFLTVPPTTPAAIFSFDHIYSAIPRPFPTQDELKLPYVREVGIKNCLDILSGYFNCEDYKLNLVKFWFLDVITDCLWKMQDEFQFPEAYQKIIVEWILYLMELIRDPRRNLSRKRFFQIFNEAMVISHEKVQAGCEFLPSPTDLFGLVEDEEEEISFPSTTPSTEECSSVSLTSEKSDEGSYLAVGIDESPQIFKMPKPQPKYCNHDDISEKISQSLGEEEQLICEEEITPHSSQLESVEFYQPDPRTPERFLSSSSSSSSFQSLPGEDALVSPIQQERFKWKRDPLPSKKNCSEELLDIKKTSTMSGLQKSASFLSSEMNVNQARKEWTTYLENRKDYVQGMEKNILINSCALFAIKQFVYDYFYETFQFTIVKLALMNSFSSITQNINSKWFVPKVLKEELKKPKPKKEKKKKKKKKEKKGKKPKKKTKSKKDKKKKKSSKKSKKDKKKKGKKKEKKEKKKKLTKAERDELARIKREQQRLEEELRKAEENRRLLFPLKDATTDEFFKSIFDQWVKPKEKKGKGKGKKGKTKK